LLTLALSTILDQCLPEAGQPADKAAIHDLIPYTNPRPAEKGRIHLKPYLHLLAEARQEVLPETVLLFQAKRNGCFHQRNRHNPRMCLRDCFSPERGRTYQLLLQGTQLAHDGAVEDSVADAQPDSPQNIWIYLKLCLKIRAISRTQALYDLAPLLSRERHGGPYQG
jgi:hypothetical protein